MTADFVGTVRYLPGMHINTGTYGQFTPYIYVVPRHLDDDGVSEASVIVELTGQQTKPQLPSARLSLSLDEAESLAKQLLGAVENSRAGKVDDFGRQVVAGHGTVLE